MTERKLTDEQLADANRLEKLFLKRQEEAKTKGEKISQESIAFLCGWKTQANFNSYMKGRKPIGLEAAMLMAKALNATVEEISPSLASQITSAPVAPYYPRDGQTLESMSIRPVIDIDETDLDDDEFEYPFHREVYISGGATETLVLEKDIEPSKMEKEIARRAGASMTYTFGFNLEGNSMSPKILDKAHVLADGSKKHVKDGKIYCFRHGVMRRTKYLFNRPDGGLLIRSENREEYPDEIIKPEDMYDIEILGWVYHWCNTEVW